MTTLYGTFKATRAADDTYTISKYVANGWTVTSYPRVVANDLVVHTQTGLTYKVRTAGYLGKKTYAILALESNRTPVLPPQQPANLAISRNGTTYTAKWTLPSDWNNAKSNRRATSMTTQWVEGSSSPTEHPAVTSTSSTRTITRSKYYPLTDYRLVSIVFGVYGSNWGGDGKQALASYLFEKPLAPTVDAFEFDPSSGILSTTIRTDAGAGERERYDTRYSCYVYDQDGAVVATVADGSSTETAIPIEWNAQGYRSLAEDEYYRVEVKATARGIRGDSAQTKASYYLSFPRPATIKGVDVSNTGAGGRCTVRIGVNDVNKAHPVDEVELEYIKDVSFETVEDIPSTQRWTASGIVDDAMCTALAIGVETITPQPGTYTWVRIKSWHADEDYFYRYSRPVRVTALETPAPTAADEKVKVLSAAQVDDTSILVQLAWNEDGQDDATGTELSWSDSENTWKSTEEPNTYTFEWSDGQLVDGSTTYRDSAAIVVKNLEEGEPVYIKARRYLEADSGTTWSDYSSTYMFIPYAAADNVVAVADRYVAKGSSLRVSWSFGSYAYQTAWQIVRADGLVIAAGEGINTSYEIPAERLESVAQNNTVQFTVQVSTGSGFLASEELAVTIAEPPTVSLTTTDVTAQPWSFGVACSTPAQLQVVVTSHGVSGIPELNIADQLEGDTVHSALVEPEWTTSQGTSTATVELPVVGFRNNGTYTVEVTAIDAQTGLQSTASAEVSVDWAHPAPDADASLYPTGEVDADGKHLQSVGIDLTAPSGAAATDVYDVYRISNGRAVLIGEGLPSGTYFDDFAPFGSGVFWYRIATRTADGDVAFSDFDYELDGRAMRFDWEGYSLELPYNIAISDSWAKNVETRAHLDGSVNAYWNSAVQRKSSLSSDVIRLTQLADIELAQRMARYPGAIFVRTPDGSAYEADVQVTDMSTTGMVEAIAVDAQEIDATGAFVLRADDQGGE